MKARGSKTEKDRVYIGDEKRLYSHLRRKTANLLRWSLKLEGRASWGFLGKRTRWRRTKPLYLKQN
jgi:hypothetical protein